MVRRLVSFMAVVAVASSAGSVLAQQPYPQQPYPPRPYPQQPYPQQYPPQPYLQQYPPPQHPQQYPPQYPQYPPPQQPAPPPPSSSPSSSSRPWSSSSLGANDVALSAAIGASLAHQEVEIGNAGYRSFSGGLFLYGNIISSLIGLSRSRIAVNVHGGGVGLDTRAAASIFVGPGVELFKGATALFHVGVQGYGLDNDEVRASMLELPAASMALLFDVSDVAIAFGPEAGLALRTEYAPGDEDQARRHRRKRTSDLAAGGFASITWEHFAIDAVFSRIVAHDPLWVVDGEACAFIGPVAACGFMQYWKSVAALAQPGLPLATDSALTIPSLYIGGSIGFGAARAIGR